MSNAIGLASLRRLDETNQKRRNFLELLIAGLDERRSVCKPMAYHSGFAPFYFPLIVDQTRVTVDAEKFALAVQAEGIPLGAKYGCIVSTWPWVENLVVDTFVPVNAISARDRSFNLHLNENYGPTEVRDILDAIDKVGLEYRR
jgi:dTDP-4-amino-4,6-dideoxygalactose transaminase